MLELIIPGGEGFDEIKQEFCYIPSQTLRMEHSLLSISKWESKWNKPFFSKNNNTYEEWVDYLRCMTLNQHVPRDIYYFFSQENIDAITQYINAPMTATTFSKSTRPPNREIITSEIIYYWMTVLNIPIEFEKWHINRLITLIRVCNIKNQPGKKRSTRSILSSNAALNKARRARLGTKG